MVIPTAVTLDSVAGLTPKCTSLTNGFTYWFAKARTDYNDFVIRNVKSMLKKYECRICGLYPSILRNMVTEDGLKSS